MNNFEHNCHMVFADRQRQMNKASTKLNSKCKLSLHSLQPIQSPFVKVISRITEKLDLVKVISRITEKLDLINAGCHEDCNDEFFKFASATLKNSLCAKDESVKACQSSINFHFLH